MPSDSGFRPPLPALPRGRPPLPRPRTGVEDGEVVDTANANAPLPLPRPLPRGRPPRFRPRVSPLIADVEESMIFGVASTFTVGAWSCRDVAGRSVEDDVVIVLRTASLAASHSCDPRTAATEV
jgi:hypothetical protein